MNRRTNEVSEPGDGRRIAGRFVDAIFAESGQISCIVYGEAPGPRGADQSGIPFWGDGAGIPLYRALILAGCAQVSEQAWLLWDGARLREAGLRPLLCRVALSNAFPLCPTDDGHRFRAPRKSEWSSENNLSRIRRELENASQRGCRRVITLGRCAAQALQGPAKAALLCVVNLPHPSSQGLLMDAPGRGRGMRLVDLQAAWQHRLVEALNPGRTSGP